MFLAAIAHHYSFSYKPYINDLVEKRTLCDALITMWDVSDVHADLNEHFGVVGMFVLFVLLIFNKSVSNEHFSICFYKIFLFKMVFSILFLKLFLVQ